MAFSPGQDDDSIALSAQRKAAWRILPLIFVLYVIAYLDRANVSFAKLRMQNDLSFSDEVFGWGIGLFFIGYLFLEIPGALLVERWSARKWFARILVTWGLCSMGMALVNTPEQFYIARFLLGLAEAGFFPGVIVYFSHWFPKQTRARALSGMLIAVPLSLALGAQVSNILLRQDWFGLAGWQWVFLVEGLPAVLFGVAVPFLLTDRPRQARWLSPDEREWLESTLEAEREETRAIGATTLGQALSMPTVWQLALGILAINTGGYALVFWLPTAVQELLRSTDQDPSDSAVLGWSSLYYFCGLLGVVSAGYLSDRLRERKWHCVVAVMMAGIALGISTLPGLPWAAVFAALCVTAFWAYFWLPPFWVLPTQALTASAAAVAVGVINMSANLAGFFSGSVFGLMKQAGLDDRLCLLTLAGCYISGGFILATLRLHREPAAVDHPEGGNITPPPTEAPRA